MVIVKDTSIVYIGGFGVQKTGASDSVDANTLFRLGSVSKGFAGVLTGILAEKQILDWNDKVKQSLPSFTLKDTAQTQRVEVRHLLSHTTGLPLHSYTNLVEAGMSVSDIMPKLGQLNLIGKEGSIMSYQNVAFAIIEELIAHQTGKPYTEWLQEEIFSPAKMTYSSSSHEGLTQYNNIAMPHAWSYKHKRYYTYRLNKKYYNAVSAGGINASISDMGQWLKLLLGGMPEIVSEQTLDQVFEPEVNTSRARKYFNRWPGVKQSHYAKGWRVIDYDNRRVVYHGGYVNQYRSEIAIDRENKIGICVLFNAPVRYSSKVIPEFIQYCENVSRDSTTSLTHLP